MRFLFTFLLLASLTAYSQIRKDNCKSITDIATMERLAHQRIASTENLTTASGNFDVKYYRCEWEVDPAIRYIKGKVTVYYTITSATDNILLDLMSPLVADSVQQHNVLLAKSQANNTLTINFPGTVDASTLDSVSIFYQGVPPNTGFGSFIQSTHAGTPVMWSLSEPYGSRDWWPCKNGLDDKADSIDVLVTNPIAYKAASNGILQSETISADGTKITAHWKHRYAIASYLICFAVTNYTVFNNTVQLSTGVLPMQTYCYPESLSSFQNGTINTLNAMQLYDATFGPYPFRNEKYGHVQFGWGGGMEHQTSTFVINIDESLCAHELGHQWFGDKITCGSWKDVWLNESFATHLASMYMEKKYPASIISTRKSEISTITSQPGGSVEVSDTTDVNRIFDSRLSYTKGSHLLYMLRWKLGDDIFFNALRNYQTDPAIIYGFAKTADLKRNLEQTSGQDLTNFFNQWYSGQGYPTYNVQWSNSGSGNVWIKMNQVTSHVSVPFFELPVALQFKNATQSATVIVNNTSNGEVFIKPIGFVADTVIIDPEAWLITKNNTTTKLPTCGTVTGLASSSITTATATISWSATGGANNYDVDYKLTSSSTWTNAATATASRSVNLAGLTASSLYDWRVKPNCTAPTGNYVLAQFTTNAVATCGTVTGLNSSAITSSGATVQWSALSGANNYTADYKPASSGTWVRAATGTTSLSINLSGLAAGSLYDWRVNANCTGATGAFAQAQFTTNAATCGTVTGLNSSAITSSGATVQWSALSGANNYTADYKPASSGTWIRATTGTTSLSINLSGLAAGSLYDWRVNANCTGATGAFAQAQFTTNAASCGTVTGLNSSAITSSGATVKWSALSGANNYTVDYKPASSGTWVRAATGTTSLSINLSGLAAGSLYDWRVNANCNGATGAFAQAQFTTNAATCGTVSGLNSSAITSSGATVKWSALSGANNYTVDYKPASSGTWVRAATGTTSLSINLSGLAAGSLYDWRVNANCTGATGAFAQAQFTTSVAITCPGPYDVSTNGTRSGAALVQLNTDIKGKISPVNDIDYYRFHITTRGTISVTLQTLPANYDLDLQNTAGTRIGRSNKNGTSNETINVTVTTGDYYAKVYPSGSANNATLCYTLKITTGTAARSAIIAANPGDISVKLFPNPANQVLNISMKGYKGEKIIEVFDLNGKRLISERVMQDDKALPIGKLPSGLYMISVTARDGNIVSRNKFVKE